MNAEGVEARAAPPPAAPGSELATLGESGAHGASTDVATATAAALRARIEADCTPCEEAFAREYVLLRNATEAYARTHDTSEMQRHVVRQRAWELVHRPHVARRIREYERAAAQQTVINLAELLESDLRIVRGFRDAQQVTSYVWECCRYCYGVEHAYQWVDLMEYLTALQAAQVDNDARRARKLSENPLPTDSGGYGFKASAEPNIACPKCEGRGHGRTVFADTTKLTGDVASIVRGIKETQHGTEVLLHDYDKAKDRLYRASGAYGDDAASVARAAAAGAAAGTGAAAAVAERAKTMTAEEARKAYLALVG